LREKFIKVDENAPALQLNKSRLEFAGAVSAVKHNKTTITLTNIRTLHRHKHTGLGRLHMHRATLSPQPLSDFTSLHFYLNSDKDYTLKESKITREK
jgi:hypothetical protein